MKVKLKLEHRNKIRSLVGLGKGDKTPVVIVPGNAQPKIVGSSGGFFTKSGERISHPGAYAKKGFSNMKYVRSTQRVEVGFHCLAEAIGHEALQSLLCQLENEHSIFN